MNRNTDNLPRYALALLTENLDKGDRWGSVMGMLFPLAEVYRRHFGVSPDGYFPSPAEYASEVPCEYGEDYTTTDLWDAYRAGDFDGEEISYAYGVLTRYSHALEAAGESY